MKKMLFIFVFLFLVFAQETQANEPEMVFVKGGCFEMGDIFDDDPHESVLPHRVCLDDFYIGKYEVTKRVWEEITDEIPFSSKKRGRERWNNFGEDYPIHGAKWKEVRSFIRKLNRQSGMKYRFPTEAEWEYAARSGGKREMWAGTNDFDKLEDYTWFNNNVRPFTHSVGKKLPNGLGIYDMSGNVDEWVWDRYSPYYYKSSPANNPKGPRFHNPLSSGRVSRGGSSSSNVGPGAYRITTTIRRYLHFHIRDLVGDIGFRLAHSAEDYEKLKAASKKKEE